MSSCGPFVATVGATEPGDRCYSRVAGEREVRAGLGGTVEGRDSAARVPGRCSCRVAGWNARHAASRRRVAAFILRLSGLAEASAALEWLCRARDVSLSWLDARECDHTCASGGIGRRAGFRCQYSQGCGGSSPPSRTTYRKVRVSMRLRAVFVCGAGRVCRSHAHVTPRALRRLSQ